MIRLAAALAACLVGSTAAAAPPALQELAGASRDAPPGPAFRQALDEPHEAAAALPILFPAGSARLTPSATRLLDGLDRPTSDRLRIEAHAGRDRDLAVRRAKAVATYLAENCGVAADRLQTATPALPDDRRVIVVDLGP